MLSSVSNLAENADDRSLIQACACTNGGNRNVANLVIVNAGDVHLAPASWFAGEDAIGAPNKAVGSPVNKGVFGALKMLLADAMLECRGG